MAVSTCLRCAGHSSELAMFTPMGESHKLTIVQCTGCGTPISVMDPASGPLLDLLREPDHGHLNSNCQSACGLILRREPEPGE